MTSCSEAFEEATLKPSRNEAYFKELLETILLPSIQPLFNLKKKGLCQDNYTCVTSGVRYKQRLFHLIKREETAKHIHFPIPEYIKVLFLLKTADRTKSPKKKKKKKSKENPYILLH